MDALDDYDEETVRDTDVDRITYVPESEVGRVEVSSSFQSRREIVRQEVKKLLEHMSLTSEEIDLNLDRFKVERANGVKMLYFEKSEGNWEELTKRDGQLRSDGAIRKVLTKRRLDDLGISPIQKLDRTVPTERELEMIPMQDLGGVIDMVTDAVSVLPMRELLGLDKTLRSIRGEYDNSYAKLAKTDEHIEREEAKLGEALNEQQKDRIRERIADLKNERDARWEFLSHQKKELQSQLSRIRQTIDKVADGDRTLKERLSILWREQGLTIASVLTAIGMTIGTLVLALTPGGGGAPTPKQPHKVRDWVKKSLNALGRVFARVAKWALGALPGALGSLISWLFNFLKTIVTKAAEHVYATIGGVAVLVTYLVGKEINGSYHRKRSKN